MCGSPAAIVERMARAKETLHLDTQLVMIDMGGMPDDDIRASLELFGEHVLPAVAAWT
jgi:alkanesulfonate monooxygenase SsuD/methylene tetrahydromethanopterin reductase-like flavin-dependent oxidoreductase (luciferase family)